MREPIRSGDEAAGFSLLELTGSMAIIVVMVLAMQGSLISSVGVRQANAQLEIRQQQAYDYTQRLMTIPFGKAADPSPTAALLTNLFDGDQNLGAISLKQVETAANLPGHSFTTLVDGVRTNWRVSVSNDLDGDGQTTGPREGRTDLLRIRVFADGVLMFQTTRAADVPNTTKD